MRFYESKRPRPPLYPPGGLDWGLKSVGQNRPIAKFTKGRDTKKNATRSAPVLVEKVLQARRHFAALGASVSKLVGNDSTAVGGLAGTRYSRSLGSNFLFRPVELGSVIGIDTGKNTLHLIGLDDKGAIVLREKIARGRITARLANVPRCLIGIEAGMATHYVARELSALGHDVKQVPPAYAKPFRRGHRTTSETPTRSRRLSSGRPPAAFQ